MKPIKRYNESYFQRFRTTPVEIKPFDPQAKAIAAEYIDKLKHMFSDFKDYEIIHKGSTALGILGKGEIEIAIYPHESEWFKILIHLINNFKSIGNLDEDYTRFNDSFTGMEIEIVLIKGYPAKVDRKLFEYLQNNTQALKKYEELKQKYAYSKREYKIKQNEFFESIIKQLPEE